MPEEPAKPEAHADHVATPTSLDEPDARVPDGKTDHTLGDGGKLRLPMWAWGVFILMDLLITAAIVWYFVFRD